MSLAARIVALAVLLLCAAVGMVSHTALNAFEREVRPALEREAMVVGRIGAATLQRALDLGVPFDRLEGVSDYLAAFFAAREGLTYLVLTDAAGTVIASAGATQGFVPLAAGNGTDSVTRLIGANHDIAQPLRQGAEVLGWVHAGIGRARIETALNDMRWDIVMVLLVVLLATSEFLRFIVAREVVAPIAMVLRVEQRLAAGDWTARADGAAGAEAGRVARHLNVLIRRMNDRWERLVWLAGEAAAGQRGVSVLGDVANRLRFGAATPERLPSDAAMARLPLFLFVFAEQLSTSFIPLHAMALPGSGGALGAALPIAAFVAAVALTTPWGGAFVARRGPRAAMLWGMVPAIAGHLGAALAQDAWAFAAARAVAGIGYAIVTIACQVHLAREAPQGRLARSLGGFTGAVMTGAVCGTAIGAVLADRLGFALTFAASALLVGGLALLVWREFAAGGATEEGRQSLWRGARDAFAEPRFVALVVFAAIPAKVLLAGFIFFLAPIALREIGLGQAAIGRHVMLYGLCMLPAILLGAWLADRTGRGGLIIVGAGIANGLGLLLPLGFEPDVALPAAIIITGVAQGLAAAPMLAIIPGRVPSAARLSFLRLAERFGSVVGPPAAAGLLALGGGAQAMLALGLLSLVTAIGYAIALLLARGRESQAR